ncbi:unnamed protein product [Spodoptera exigua]|nr:unnamed protein product [Spodoptera exigua]
MVNENIQQRKDIMLNKMTPLFYGIGGKRADGSPDDTQSAVAMISSQSCCKRQVLGVIRFQQTEEGALVADGSIDGLPAGMHGVHVHTAGDLSQGCKSIGEHYNPCGAPHGAPEDPMDRRHAGDLGNIVADETGRATFRIVDNVLKKFMGGADHLPSGDLSDLLPPIPFFMEQVWDIIGRSVAVTERKDDLGRGSSPSSKIDGDSGTPIACGIIARSAGVFQNPKRICACDGVVVWDEKDRPLAGKGRREEKPKRRCCENHNNSNVVNPCFLGAEVAVPHCAYPAPPADHQPYRAPSVVVYWLFEARAERYAPYARV